MSQDNWLRIHNISQEYKIIENACAISNEIYKEVDILTKNF